MPSADSDGVSIHYELAGTGDALVLIGGLGVHTGEYRPLIDALARRHEVLAADVPAQATSPTSRTATG